MEGAEEHSTGRVTAREHTLLKVHEHMRSGSSRKRAAQQALPLITHHTNHVGRASLLHGHTKLFLAPCLARNCSSARSTSSLISQADSNSSDGTAPVAVPRSRPCRVRLGLPTYGRTAPRTRARSCYYTRTIEKHEACSSPRLQLLGPCSPRTSKHCSASDMPSDRLHPIA